MAGVGQGKSWFRGWLVNKLAATRQILPKVPEPELAEWLGVSVEVLREARAASRGTRTFGGYKKFDGVQVVTWRTILPCPILRAFDAFSKNRDVPLGTLLRSVVHWSLMQYDLPTTDNYAGGKGWELQGIKYRLARKAAESGKSKDRCDVSCQITRGAYEALHTRACLRGTVPTGIVRGALLDLLDGRIEQLDIISSALIMFDRSVDYFKFWKEDEEKK